MKTQHEPRFEYAGPYRSVERASDELANLFEQGDVSEGERPRVTSRQVRRDGKRVTRWFVTLAA